MNSGFFSRQIVIDYLYESPQDINGLEEMLVYYHELIDILERICAKTYYFKNLKSPSWCFDILALQAYSKELLANCLFSGDKLERIKARLKRVQRLEGVAKFSNEG